MAREIDYSGLSASVVVGGVEIRHLISYDLKGSMLEPAASFNFSIPFTRDAWEQVAPDTPVKFYIDGVQRLVGFIDTCSVPEGGDLIQVSGRDLVGRLVQDCAPSINYSGLAFVDLLKKIAEPWFTKVTLDNSRNREVTRGRGKRAAAKPTARALTLDGNKKWGTRIEPGQTRWQVIEQLCEQAGVMCWAAGDGRELVLGAPQYEQEVQFSFFHPAADSPRLGSATVISMGVSRSVADAYSRVICVGSGQGTDANYTSAATRRGEARDNPEHPEGVGGLFSAPKRLVVQRAVNTIREAEEFAESELLRRYARADEITVTAAGHGQRIAGAYDTLFNFDLLARCEHEPTRTEGVYIITGYEMSGDRAGQKTSMHLVPRGTALAD